MRSEGCYARVTLKSCDRWGISGWKFKEEDGCQFGFLNTQKISEELNIMEAVSEKERSSSANPSWLNKCQNKKALKR